MPDGGSIEVEVVELEDIEGGCHEDCWQSATWKASVAPTLWPANR